MKIAFTFDALPRNPTGKLMKRELKQLFVHTLSSCTLSSLDVLAQTQKVMHVARFALGKLNPIRLPKPLAGRI